MERKSEVNHIAILTSHPIQYQAPFFEALAKDERISPVVYFVQNIGVDRPMFDSEFGREVRWDLPLLRGYSHVFLRGWWSFVTELYRNRPQSLLVLGWNSFYTWIGFAAAKLLGISFWVRGENPLSQEPKKLSALRRAKRGLLRLLFRNTDRFLYIGNENKKFYEHMGASKDRLFFVPYAVDNERLFRAAEAYKNKKSDLRVKYGIPNDAIVILFAGKLISKKRPEDLLRAYAGVAERTSGGTITALVYAGDGALADDLQNIVKEEKIPNVFFLGFRNQTELPECYAMADIFVLPSGIGETWGLVVNEAMCFGLPVIISDIVGSGTDLVHEGENGHIVPCGNAAALERAITELVESRSLRIEYGKKSVEIVSGYGFAADIDGMRRAYETRK
ncbi:MAG: glycosyltransferase family 4 protein [Patescibacteria group bacterium]